MKYLIIVWCEIFDINNFCEFEFYDQIKLWDNPVQFPENNTVLGSYYIPIIDMGPAINGNILKEKGEVVHRSRYYALTIDNSKSSIDNYLCDRFD